MLASWEARKLEGQFVSWFGLSSSLGLLSWHCSLSYPVQQVFFGRSGLSGRFVYALVEFIELIQFFDFTRLRSIVEFS